MKDFWDDIGAGLCYLLFSGLMAFIWLWAVIKLIKFIWFL